MYQVPYFIACEILSLIGILQFIDSLQTLTNYVPRFVSCHVYESFHALLFRSHLLNQATNNISLFFFLAPVKMFLEDWSFISNVFGN